jgi:hypothetical protein
MPETLLIAASIALLLTAAFTFRFRMWSRPGVVASYFATFLALEYLAERLFLPAGALGLEVMYLCLPLVAVFGVAIAVARRIERGARPEAGGGGPAP